MTHRPAYRTTPAPPRLSAESVEELNKAVQLRAKEWGAIGSVGVLVFTGRIERNLSQINGAPTY